MRLFKYITILLILSSSLHARSDAIIVGVGKYKHNIQSLRGVSSDMKHIKEILKELNITHVYPTLFNENATLLNVRNALKKYIKSPKNREGNLFVFYYSGHGVQVKDLSGDEKEEKNGSYPKDEAFALHDVKMSFNKKLDMHVITGGLLLDDEFYSLIRQIKSKKVLILDKCHSDSSDRAILSYTKSFNGKYTLSREFNNKIEVIYKNAEKNSLINNIVFSASGSDEIAEDSIYGGLFTLSLRDAIVYHKAQKNGSLTIQELQDFCDKSIYLLASKIRKESNGKWQPRGAFSPSFRPNRLMNSSVTSIFNTKLSTSFKVKEKRERYLLENTLDSLVSSKIIELYMRKKSYVDGHKIVFEIISKKRGYLNVFVAYRDSYHVFMKNELVEKKDNNTYPTDFHKAQHLIAEKSQGLTKIYVVLSKKPIDIDKYLKAEKNNNLGLTNYFRKELMPSKEYKEQIKKNKIQKNREVKEIKGNILSISKVEFNVK